MAVTNLQKMSCGGCGVDQFMIYKKKDVDELHVECQGCKSISIISCSKPTLEIDWGENADGLLTVFPENL